MSDWFNVYCLFISFYDIMSLQSKLAHPTDVLKFAFWNINGYKSKILGNKLVLRDFLQEIGNNDIVSLAETHIQPKTLDYQVLLG